MATLPPGGGTAHRDRGRPRLHFTPESGWINDPHGLTWHGGRYHLFFQHLPGRAAWGLEAHWGHAVSDDLVRWTERPVALSPGDGDDGIWSGSVVTDMDGVGRAFYTTVRSGGHRLGRVRAAHPTTSSWDAWRKGDLVVAPPAHLDLVEFRDPHVLHDGTGWRMLVGGGTSDGTALVLSWTSPDLDTWTCAGVLASRPGSETDPVWTGTGWECPQLFRLAGSWVLLVSVWERDTPRYEAYAVGDLVDGRFSARRWHRLTYGPAHYAGSAFTDADGRPGLLHWLRGVADPGGSWAGAHSVPHALRLEGDRVVAEPHPHVRAASAPLVPGTRRAIGDAVLTYDGDAVSVQQGAATFSMPCAGGPAQLLVDPPVVEVFGPQGVAGFATRALSP